MYSIADITLETVELAGHPTRLARLGEGRPVLLVHGWPECWYSWRHQIVALANAGYQVVAPDMPGYGGTARFATTEDYNIQRIADFLETVNEHCGWSEVLLVGHDWGATIAWLTVLLYPQRYSRLVTLSVPLRYHGSRPPTSVMQERFADRFFYQLYFQLPGKAEAEFDNDPEAILSRLYLSPGAPREKPRISSSDPSTEGGWIDRLGAPLEQPDWLTPEELAYYVKEFKRTGFIGGINYYRNIDRNWEIMRPYAEKTIDIPVLFMAGDGDSVIAGFDRAALQKMMGTRVPQLEIVLLPGIGHWIQQEAAAETSQAILAFFADQ